MNFHKNRLDMTKLYQLRDQRRADEIRKKREEEQQREEDMKQFNAQIRSQGGKLTLNQLRRLTTWKKTSYIQMVMENDDVVNEMLQDAKQKVLKSDDELINMLWDIEDTQNVWSDQMERINDALEKKAEEIGMLQQKNVTKFQEFNI